MPNRSSLSNLGRFFLPLLAAACAQGASVGSNGSDGDVAGRTAAPSLASIEKGQEAKRLAFPVAASDSEAAALIAKSTALQQFLGNEGKGWEITFDRRSGLPMLMQGPGIAWMPGAGNTLDATATLGASFLTMPAKDQALALATHGEGKARNLLASHSGLFGYDHAALALDRAWTGSPDGENELFLVTFRHQPSGVEQHDARLTFVVNHGNLIQIHSERMLPAASDLQPRLTDAQAFARLRKDSQIAVEPKLSGVDLKVVHLAPTAGAPGVYGGPIGQGYESRLAYLFHFTVDGDTKTYGAYVDAQSGRVLELFDDNKYVAGVTGGIYPRTIASSETIVPFVDTSVTNGSGLVTDLGGNFNYTGGTASTSLGGANLSINDNCGAPAASSTAAPGDLSLGTSTGSDCTFSATGHSTRAARNAFYHLNNVRRMGQKWLAGTNAKADSWFASNVGVNVNIGQTCNAYWNGSTVNFFKSGNGCGNTGEISDVMQHEWAHGLDANTKTGSVGDSAKGEAIADTVALLMTHDSCVGPAFLASGGETTYCSTGVRDLAKVVTAANIASVCSRSSSCAGYLGYECHCESHILSGAHWKLQQLFVTRYGAEEGWNRFEKGYLRAFPNMTSYQVGTPGNAYDVWLAADDDNGNVTDGTPNADIIYQAFNAQGIAGTQRSRNVTTCATPPTAPTATATGNAGSIGLSWTAVSGAASYTIYRSQGHNDGAGYLPLASGLTATTYSDAQVRPSYAYTYQVVAFASGCPSALGAGVTATASGGTTASDFSIALGSSSTTVAAGSSTTVSIATGVTSGSAQSISLTVTGLPTGVTGTISPASVTAGGSATLTITAASSAAAASATYTVTGTAASGTHSASGSLTVTTGTPTSDFSIAVASSPNSVAAGASINVAVTTAAVSGAAQTIALSVTGLPTGVTGTFSPASVTTGGSSTLTLTAATTAPAVTADAYTVMGAAGSTSHTANGAVTVTTGGGGSTSLTNGNFEAGSLAGWTVAGAAGVTSAAHGGSFAALVGSSSPTSGDSSISQTFTAPAAGGTLSFWYNVHCPDTITYDWATATLKNNATGTTATLLAPTCSNTGAWTQVSATVAGGTSYTLTLTSHDDNYSGDATYVLFDDVAISGTFSGGLANGGFEAGTFAGWTTTGTDSVTTVAHSGGFAAVVGSPSPTSGDSTLSQTFTAPTGTSRLSLFYASKCPDTISYDWAIITLRDNTANTTATMLSQTCAAVYQWTNLTSAVTAGHSYTLKVTNHDDNYAGDATYTLVDDVILQ